MPQVTSQTDWQRCSYRVWPGLSLENIQKRFCDALVTADILSKTASRARTGDNILSDVDLFSVTIKRV